MTIIAACMHEGKVWMAGDSSQSGDKGTIYQVADPKVWKSGDFVFGCADSPRYAQIVQHAFVPPPLPKAKDINALDAYFTVDFIPELRKSFKTDLELKGDDKYADIEMIVGVRGYIYEIWGDFSWSRPRDGFAAVGSGHLAARVALDCLPNLHPRNRLKRALDAACKYTIFCRPPFVFEVV